MNFSKIFSYTLRVINKNRVYSVINLLGLSIGLTVFALIVLFVQYEFGYDKHNANLDKIYRVVRDGEGEYLGSTKFVVCSAPIADAIKETVRDAEFVTRINWRTNVLITANGNSFFENEYHAVDPDFFNIFSLEVIAGERDGLLTDPTDVVLTESIAVKYYGSAENAIGKNLAADTGNHQLNDFVVQAVVRDMPFQSHFRVRIFFQFEGTIKIIQPSDFTAWNNNNYFVYFTLQPGTDIPAAEKALNDYVMPKLGYTPAPFCMFQPLSDTHLGEKINFDLGVTGNKEQLYIFLCIGILVLIIACINYVNMSTARAANRAKEIGVRKVNGALRIDLIVQFMFEAFLSTVVAAAVAVVAVSQLLPAYNIFLDKQISVDFLLQPGSILFGALMIAAVGIIAGAYPAFLFSSFKPIHTLKGTFRQSHHPALRNALVVFQFIVSGTLVFCTLIIWKQMEFVRNKDLGFNHDHIITVRLRDKALYQRTEEIREMLLRNPAIHNVTASGSPATGISSQQGRMWQGKNGEQHISIYVNPVDPHFIDVYEIPLVAGQNLSPVSWKKDIVVNETLVRELGFTNDEIIGRSFIANDTARVIGVVADFHYMDMKLKILPMEFRSFAWSNPRYLSIRIQENDIPTVVDFIQKTMAGFSEKYPFEYSFYDEVYSKTFIAEAKTSKLMSIFSAVAIIIAALGLYGLILHMVNQRMKEIGIRKTLGAGSWSIVRLLSGRFGMLIVAGYAIACVVGYYGIGKWLETFAYKISPGIFDFAITLLAIAAVAAIAVYSRIAVALKVNPADVLKQTD